MAAHYSLDFIADMELCVVVDMIRRAQEHETEQRRWGEWLSFAPIASVLGHPIKYSEFKAGGTISTATDTDIEGVRAFMQRDKERRPGE